MRCFHCMRTLQNNVKFCPYCGSVPQKPNPPHQLAAGTALHNRFFIGNAAGEDGFCITYTGHDQVRDAKITVREYFPSGAVKRDNARSNMVALVSQSAGAVYQKGRENFWYEAKNLADFSRAEGIETVREFFTANNTAYAISDYPEGDSLEAVLRERGCFTLAEVITLLLPVMRALEKLHTENILHRGIAPGNIICQKTGRAVLTDFGTARYFAAEQNHALSVVLKPGYAPFELYSAMGSHGAWTDVYSLCAVIYRCITGVVPPDAPSRRLNDTLQKPSALGVTIPQKAELTLMKGLAVFPQERCQSMGELINGFSAAIADSMDAPQMRFTPPPKEQKPAPPAAPPVKAGSDDAEELIDDEERAAIKKENKRFIIIEAALLIIAALLAAAIVYIHHRTPGLETCVAQGTSMQDTLNPGDTLGYSKLNGAPKCGDIIVISQGEGYDAPLIKRVIATGGQTLFLDYDNDKIYVDGKQLSEPYLKGGTFDGNEENYTVPSVIPEGKVFVLGDNRKPSIDSRHKEVGLIDLDNILGKAEEINGKPIAAETVKQGG